MSEIKFRIWNENSNEYEFNGIGISIMGEFMLMGEYNNLLNKAWKHDYWNDLVIEQYIGLEDKNGNEYYINDIGEFENGDRFIIKIEDFLQFYIEWIGNPKCEDQGRDLYRIERAERIGNIHQNADLLTK